MQSNQDQHLVGAFLLADLTKKPPFLTRNIKQRLPCEKDKRSTSSVPRLNRDHFDLGKVIHFTTMNQRLSPKLRVSLTGLSPRGRRTSSGAPQSVLRGRDTVIDVRCRLRIQIHSARNADASIVLHETHRIARLHGERQTDGKFEMSLALTVGEKPFEFHMDLLKDIVENEITWREAMAEHYAMRFRISFSHPADAKIVFQALGLGPEASPQDGLWATWSKLPRCPTSNSPLGLFAGKDIATRYVLNVSMGWGTEEWLPRTSSKRPATPLECLSGLKRRKMNTQLPTPASTPGSNVSTVSTDFAVRYHINSQLIEVDGYHCVIGGCQPYDLGSLDRLEHHLATCHPCLKFKVDVASSLAEANASVADIFVTGARAVSNPRVRGRDRFGRALGHANNFVEDLEWITPVPPETPLTLQQVSRDEQWMLRTTSMDRETHQLAKRHEPQAFASAASIKLELPTRVRELRRVVPHPLQHEDASFLSSDNKAVLVPGELLPDEEDLIDASHIDLARQVRLTKEIADPKARRFLLDINSHIESEGLSADKYLGPCLRRWLHKRREWMHDRQTANMFERFMWSALQRAYVSDEVYQECMDVLRRVRNRYSGALTAVATPPDIAAQTPRARETCSCGKDLVSVRDRVSCYNKSCAYPHYHKSCMLQNPAFAGRNKLPAIWFCPTCLEIALERYNQILGQEHTGAALDLLSLRNFEAVEHDQINAKQAWASVFKEHGCESYSHSTSSSSEA